MKTRRAVNSTAKHRARNVKDPPRARRDSFGPTLTALEKQFRASWGEDLFSLVDSKHDKDIIAYCRNEHGIELLGRSHDGLCYFGTATDSAEQVIDRRPVVMVDNKGIDPEIVANNLADYLSLCATSISWGTSPVEWKDLQEEATQNPDFLALRKRLLAIPGVKLLARPWELQRSLPSFARASASTQDLDAGGDASLQTAIEELFDRELAKLCLLLVIDDITEIDDGKVQINVLIDGPPQLEDVLPEHPIIREGLTAFMASLRVAFPGRELTIATCYATLIDESLPAERRSLESWKRLAIALRLAGREDVYQELRKRVG
jgi:hypothetical protein